ncbi:hypothetical protein SVAN01_00706 [Stagonosporopsis vannaccii]|nr:hypothetical protein SVAN01_00706 [Stagonosporopsis vannaccii]
MSTRSLVRKKVECPSIGLLLAATVSDLIPSTAVQQARPMSSQPAQQQRSLIRSPLLNLLCINATSLSTRNRPANSTMAMAAALDMKPAVSYESRLLSCGPCQGHLFAADAAHDLYLPDWDRSTARTSRRQNGKEWFQSANFQQRTYREDCPTRACESEARACWRQSSGVQAKLFL